MTTAVWLVGAYGNVASVTMTGASLLRRGRIPPVGMVTERPALASLPLCPVGSLVFGGSDIRKGGVFASARDFARRTGAFPAELVEEAREDLDAWDANVRPGTALHAGPAVESLASEGLALQGRDLVRRLADDLLAFRSRVGAERLIVVNLASAEARIPGLARCRDLAARLDRGLPLPPSALYAWAAFEAGAAYVNFTSSVGAGLPALEAMAEERGLPHMGRDAKTGETLVKSALAPMFAGRNLEVLSWEGLNLLGNLDGAVLQDPGHGKAKLANKDRTLRRILGPGVHSKVRIDYVPSLDDWKTAWDFIHFRGFLGTRMSLQFTWQGCDSVLAAPLVLDLVRLAELALRRGEGGLMRHAACFFKAPQGVRTQSLPRQERMLLAYARKVAAASTPA